ncbi:hypothetical protein HII31_00665 [Pseudocercospora fuligena]|uniref:Uncharacterized protein n=1 Tax=Pseudocercospora fuligena TaxID=685502 RepID=A0A8H6RVL0_9PEZI|nr:hypothetical protein HII31_00665 [Pseudocercospora fuligena]
MSKTELERYTQEELTDGGDKTSTSVKAGPSVPAGSSKKGTKGKEPAGKDNTDGGELEGGPVLKTARSAKTPLPQIVLGARELCTYFPHHARWPRYLLRLLRNDWRYKDIAKAQLYARAELTKDNLKSRDDAIRQQSLTNGHIYYNDNSWTMQDWFRDHHADSAPYPAGANYPHVYTPGLDQAAWGPASQNTWTLAAGNVSTTQLTFLEMWQGVVNHPTGQDAGVLTQILHWASQQGDFYMSTHTVTDIPNIVAANQNRFVLPQEATRPDWDQRALQRLRANVPDP